MLATVKASVLRSCLEDISPLFSKGSSTVPLGLKIENEKLTVVCNNKCSYLNSIDLEEQSTGSQELVIVYRNLLDYLPYNGNLEIEMHPKGVTIYNDDISVTLPEGYSEFKPLDNTGLEYKPINSTGYLSGLRSLLNFNLASITKMEKPITVYQQLSVLKYPQLIVQARTMGLPFSGVLTPEIANLILKFQPEEVCDSMPAFLLFKRNDAYLQVSREQLSTENNFMDYMEGLSEPVTLFMDKYIDKIRSMSKINSTSVCEISLHSEGMSSCVKQEGISIAANVGNCQSPVLSAFKMPISIWQLCIRALGEGNAQILYGGDKVCLRTQSIIIIARVMI